MVSHFLGPNKTIWGFSVKKNGEKEYKVKKFTADVVRRIVDHCYEANIEMHFMPNGDLSLEKSKRFPFVMVKGSKSNWYYLTSAYDAGSFMKHIMVDGNYELCQIV